MNVRLSTLTLFEASFHMRDIRKNVLPKFIELCMDTPCLCPGLDKMRASEPASHASHHH